MEVPLESGVKRRAAGMFGLPFDHPAIEGPLKGHHHEAYAVPLPGGGRAKYREPREGLLWFDRRCFALEEELLLDLQGRVTRIPEVLDYGVLLQRFVEGTTLGVGVLERGPVTEAPDSARRTLRRAGLPRHRRCRSAQDL